MRHRSNNHYDHDHSFPHSDELKALELGQVSRSQMATNHISGEPIIFQRNNKESAWFVDINGIFQKVNAKIEELYSWAITNGESKDTIKPAGLFGNNLRWDSGAGHGFPTLQASGSNMVHKNNFSPDLPDDKGLLIPRQAIFTNNIMPANYIGNNDQVLYAVNLKQMEIAKDFFNSTSQHPLEYYSVFHKQCSDSSAIISSKLGIPGNPLAYYAVDDSGKSFIHKDAKMRDYLPWQALKQVVSSPYPSLNLYGAHCQIQPDARIVNDHGLPGVDLTPQATEICYDAKEKWLEEQYTAARKYTPPVGSLLMPFCMSFGNTLAQSAINNMPEGNQKDRTQLFLYTLQGMTIVACAASSAPTAVASTVANLAINQAFKGSKLSTGIGIGANVVINYYLCSANLPQFVLTSLGQFVSSAAGKYAGEKLYQSVYPPNSLPLTTNSNNHAAVNMPENPIVEDDKPGCIGWAKRMIYPKRNNPCEPKTHVV